MPNQVVKFDSIVIGSGQGGNPLAHQLTSEGETVALIESGPLGGTCVNTGCTPTKTMIASAQIAHYARTANRWGVNTSNVRVDLPAILRRKNEIVERSRASWDKQFKDNQKLHLYRARAHFTGPKQIQAGDDVLEAKRFFIDTGTSPAIPRVPSLDSLPYLTNASLLELPTVPEHLIILGAGYIATEFGQMFRRFGSQVTIINRGERILSQEDSDISTELQKALEQEEIKFVSRAQVTHATQSGGGVSLQLQTPAGPSTIEGSHLLIATGRFPNTADLHLDKAGVETNEKGFIVVNDRLETSGLFQ